MGPLILLFWTSGDIRLFQSQGASLAFCASLPCAMDCLDSPLVRDVLTSLRRAVIYLNLTFLVIGRIVFDASSIFLKKLNHPVKKSTIIPNPSQKLQMDSCDTDHTTYE